MDKLDKVISDVAYILDSLILLRQIHQTGDCNDEDMFVDASTIFANIYDNYKNGKLPKTIYVYE